jgi:hypothetical protein
MGPFVSMNSVGIDGACTGGTDGASFSVSLAPAEPGAIFFAAVALRAHELTPGPGCSKRAAVLLGDSSNGAGLVVLEATAPPVSGTLSGDTDWAVVALKLAP